MADFGWLGSLHSLAKGNATQYDAWLGLSANVVYQTMLINKRIADYQRRLNEILTAKR